LGRRIRTVAATARDQAREITHVFVLPAACTNSIMSNIDI
jgi:hypothetical protein